jgi:hypothetical protein
VLAHSGDPLTASVWWAWQVTPDIAIATLIPAALYASGMYRLRGRGAAPSAWRNASFFGGLAVIAAAVFAIVIGVGVTVAAHAESTRPQLEPAALPERNR